MHHGEGVVVVGYPVIDEARASREQVRDGNRACDVEDISGYSVLYRRHGEFIFGIWQRLPGKSDGRMDRLHRRRVPLQSTNQILVSPRLETATRVMENSVESIVPRVRGDECPWANELPRYGR